MNFKDEEQNDKVKLKGKTQDVLGLIKANPQITREQILNQLNVSESTNNRAVKELKDNGFIGVKRSRKDRFVEDFEMNICTGIMQKINQKSWVIKKCVKNRKNY